MNKQEETTKKTPLNTYLRTPTANKLDFFVCLLCFFYIFRVYFAPCVYFFTFVTQSLLRRNICISWMYFELRKKEKNS